MNEHKNGLMSLTTLINRLRAAHITLRWDVTASGKMVLLASRVIPRELRHALWRYSRELVICCILADVRLCRNPDRHRRYWYRLSHQFYCCERCYTFGMDNNYPLHNVPAERMVCWQSREDAIEEVMV